MEEKEQKAGYENNVDEHFLISLENGEHYNNFLSLEVEGYNNPHDSPLISESNILYRAKKPLRNLFFRWFFQFQGLCCRLSNK